MPSLYKYLPTKYVDAFVREGAVLFRARSYFRDYEDAQVRGDEFEGTKLYLPSKGLELTLTATQEKMVLPHSFESTANEDDIFVFCLSRSQRRAGRSVPGLRVRRDRQFRQAHCGCARGLVAPAFHQEQDAGSW